MSEAAGAVVSVIMPTYNSEAFLGEAIASVVAQTYPHWELIVIDDGSTDGTAAVVSEFAALEPRARVIRQENAGPAAARNRGIASARGRWVAFLDADDLWREDKLALQVARIAGRHDVVVYSQSQQIYSFADEQVPSRIISYEDCPTRVEFLRKLLTDEMKPAITCSVLLERQLLDRVGCFDEALANAEDWDLWIRLAEVASFEMIREPLVLRRKHKSSQTTTLTITRMVENHFVVIGKYCRAHPHDAVVSSALVHGHCHLDAARLYGYRRDLPRVMRHLAAVARVCPGLLRLGNLRRLAEIMMRL